MSQTGKTAEMRAKDLRLAMFRIQRGCQRAFNFPQVWAPKFPHP
jgi:hypothetical protein